MQESPRHFVYKLGELSQSRRQRLEDRCITDDVDRERQWVTFAQELYFTRGVGLLQFDRVASHFDEICDKTDVEWAINKPFTASEGRTMVHLETLNRQNALLKVLLNMGGSPNVPDSSNQTAVHHAALNKDDQSLEVLLDHGGDLYQLDVSHKTPMDYVRGNLQCERVIDQYLMRLYKLEQQDRKSISVINSLHESLIKGYDIIAINKLCCQLQLPQINHIYLSLLIRACGQGQKDMAFFFLSKMVRPFDLICPVSSITPLHVACEGNHFDIVIELVSRFPHLLFIRDNYPHRRWYPIHNACASGASDSIVAILLAGIVFTYTNQNDQTVDQFRDITFLDAFGRSPLYLAAKCGNSSHISLMTHPLLSILHQCAPSLLSLTNGMSPSTVSAVHVAILQSNRALLCQLLDAFPQAKHVSAYPGNMELKKVLKNMSIESSPSVTICESKHGELILAPCKNEQPNIKHFQDMIMSPLALAAAIGDEDIVERLLQEGALDDHGLAARFAHFAKHNNIMVNILLQQQKLGSSEVDFVADGMKISSLPMSNFVLQHISQYTKIHLQNNQLVKLPVELFQLRTLQLLDVSGNSLTELPIKPTNANEGGWNCPALKVINVSHNCLEELPAALWQLPGLKHLDARYNNIERIAVNRVMCECLIAVNVSFNRLSEIPSFFASLRDVRVSNNSLESLPESIWLSKTIIILDATANHIAKIRFPKVETIDNRPRSESVSLQARKVSGSYSSVHLSEEGISSSRSNSLYTANVQAVTSLSKLRLGQNCLKAYPAEIACFATYLEELDLSQNNIEHVNVRLVPPHVKILNFKSCNMKSFAVRDDINDDDSLCCLNGGTCTHKRHGTLNFLTNLTLANNLLTNIDFVDIGSSDLLYPNLQVLDLSVNKLAGEFAPHVQLLTKLQSLALSSNVHITALSMKLSQLSGTLFILKLDNLPNLRDPPMEYLSGPLNKTFSYMKSRLTKSEKYNTIKLMVVGCANKGRTSLVRRLMKRGPQLRKVLSESNMLIEMDEWAYLPSSGPSQVNFKIWDFSGKKSYYGIHHCFFLKRAIYLVVFSLQDGEHGVQELDWWLMNINAYAPGAPVILVGTHLDQVNTQRAGQLAAMAKTLYCNKKGYPPFVDVCCVYSTAVVKDSHVNALRKRIYDVARCIYLSNNRLVYKPDNPDGINYSDLLVEQLVPNSYMKLRKSIKDKVAELKCNAKPPILRKQEFLECFSSVMEDVDELNEAVKFLHSESFITYFADPILESFYLLDPQWICDIAEYVIETANKEVVNGIVQTDFLLKGCSVSIPDDIQPMLLALLSKLEIAMRVDKSLLLIPSLLPESIVYPDPVFVGMSHKAFDVSSSEARNIDELPADWLRSLYEDSVRLNASTENSKTNSVNVSNTELSLHSENKSPTEIKNDYLEMKTITSLIDDPGATKGDSYSNRNSFNDLSASNSDHPQYPLFNSIRSLQNSTSSLYRRRQFVGSTTPDDGDIQINNVYHPPLFRIWLVHFFPEGFWPRLLYRIASDSEINAVFTRLFPSSSKCRRKDELSSLTGTDVEGCFLWNLWKTGLAFVCEGVTLLDLKQVTNNDPAAVKCDIFTVPFFAEKFRIEVAVHISAITVVHNHANVNSPLSGKEVVGLGTKLLVLIEQHVIDIGDEWYNTLKKTDTENIDSYVICSECLADTPNSTINIQHTSCYQLSFNRKTVVCFPFKELINSFYNNKCVCCPYHQEISAQLLAPDIMFKDLFGVICGPNIPLVIDKTVVLGKGGTALVLKGELSNPRQLVAVKIIHNRVVQNSQIESFIKSQKVTLKGYQLVRKEVAILTKLSHQNLAKLCGIFTQPIMMLIELAPMGSLSDILKEYRAANTLVTPSVSCVSIYQIASGMAYLHKRHIAYLDLKPDNVLVWQYPLPNSPFHKHLRPPSVRLKITDYGISRIYNTTDNIMRQQSISGTPGYIAPEVLISCLHFDLQPEKIDVFSFAMTIYELLSLYHPYELLLDIDSSLRCDDVVSRKERPLITGKGTWTPYLMQKTMEHCWEHDPHKRPTMAAIKEWTQLPEFPSLRTVFGLHAGQLSCVCQCVVDRNHIHALYGIKRTCLTMLLSTEENLFCSSIISKTTTATLLRKRTSQYNQVWIAQESELKDSSHLLIVMYIAGDLGYRNLDVTINTTKVLAMVSVGNYMWISTIEQKLFVIHTPSMETITSVALCNASESVIGLLHIAGWQVVMVMWTGSHVWYLEDKVNCTGICVYNKQILDSPLIHWCEVVLQDRVEVWGTQENGKVVVMRWSPNGEHTNTLSPFITDGNHEVFSEHIASTCGRKGDTFDEVTLVWVSLKQDLRLMCWNATNRTPSYSLKLPLKSDNCRITCLLGCSDQICVGTSMGTVVILSAESGQLIKQLSLHAHQVRVLMELPLSIKSCICAELPMEKAVSSRKAKPKRSLPAIPLQEEPVVTQRKRGASVNYNKSIEKKLESVNRGQRPLFASIGDGLANWFRNGNVMTKSLQFLTWTDDIAKIICK